jgi:outer membrane receptor for ferrienterochelin and colicins
VHNKAIAFFLVLIVGGARIAAAQPAMVRVEVRHGGTAVSGASVVINGAPYRSDNSGLVTTDVPAGRVEIVVTKERFDPASASVDLQAGEVRSVLVELLTQSALEEHVTVSATRTGRGIEDEPMRVEVLDHEEISEKLMMTPGDIVMMLNEMGGLRVQATSPSLGAASVRIQGMRGRYTRFLSDGLPLFGQQVGSFGLLQIPPMDLGQVEVIKGVASSLYGAGAVGGVVNLVSRRPGPDTEREVLVNRASRGATDAVLWYSAPVTDRWGLTLLGSAHGQQRIDVDDDGWADLPAYARGVVRPRLFWDNNGGRTLFTTAGATWETRTGGTLPGKSLPGGGLPYTEALDTVRYDAGSVFQTLIGGSHLVSLRASMAHQRQTHQFGELLEHDRRENVFGEATIRRRTGSHTIVGGVAVERDSYQPIDLPQFKYTHTVPGIFAQDDVELAKWLAISASARVDRHSEYGTFASPRASGLFRFGTWTSRLSYGTGFFAPTPLTEETDAAGLSRLSIEGPLAVERGRSASLDIGRTFGPLSATLTFFRASIRNPAEVDRDRFVLRNLISPTSNTGIEVLGIFRRDRLAIVATYSRVRSREHDEVGEVDVPLTPRHSVGVDGMWEWGSAGRLGVEWYYTGVQRLEANPYREESEPYMIVGVLLERRFRRYRLFVNGENLTDARQTRWNPLVRPARGSDGRWTVDAWAPLDGRNINGGVRVSF